MKYCGSPLGNVCTGALCMNLAEEMKWIKTIHYMCNNCGSFGIGYNPVNICSFEQCSVLQWHVLHGLWFVWILVSSNSSANVLG